MLEISTSVKVFNKITNNFSTEVRANDNKSSEIAVFKPVSHQPSDILTWAEDGRSKKGSQILSSQHDSVEKGQRNLVNQHSNNLSPHLQRKPLRTSSLERATPKINNRYSKELLRAVYANEVEEEAKDENSVDSQEIVNLTHLHDSLQKPHLTKTTAFNKLAGGTASVPSVGTSGGRGAGGGCGFVTPDNNTMSQKSSSFLLPLQRATATAVSGESASPATSTVVSPLPQPPPTASVAVTTGSSTVAVKIPPSSFDTASSSSATSTSSDVTSSGSSSPPAGITKLETLDFTASQDAFDDLASIVGISMGADSTVPNMDGDLDLDAWIENTAQNIKPLVSTLADSSSSGLGGNNIGNPRNGGTSSSSSNLNIHTLTAVKQSTAFSLITNHHQSLMPVAAATAAAALIGGSSIDTTSAPSSSTSSTLQSLLQGSLGQSLPCANGVTTGQQITKMTQLQQRDLHHPGTAAVAAAAAASSSNHPQLPPPPYSILQNRLQLGVASSPNRIQNKLVGSSSFEMLKQLPPAPSQLPAEFTPSSSVSAVGPFGGASSAADSLPHSTNGGGDIVTGSSSCAAAAAAAAAGTLVQRRLGEMAAAAAVAHSLHSKLKHPSAAKQSAKMRHKLSGGSAPSSRTTASDAISGATVAGIDHSVGTGGKKMMHHCQICNRGFLNKSNIKVHLRTHTGEKPFKCEHCSKAFRQKAHLLKHMSIHKRISRD